MINFRKNDALLLSPELIEPTDPGERKMGAATADRSEANTDDKNMQWLRVQWRKEVL